MKKFVLANIPFLIIIIVLTTAVYANSLKGQFVSDDFSGILNNPQVRDISKALSGPHRHIQYLIWGLSIKYFGINPTPMHIFALILHIVNVFLLFTVVYKTFDKKTAIIASLLFAVHPINTEVVSWVTATIYLFTAFFLFSSLLAYISYKETYQKKYLYLVYGLFALSEIITSNYWNYIIPPFLIAFDQFILEKKFSLKSIKALIPLLLATILLFGINYMGTVKQRTELVDTGNNTPFLQRLPYSVYMHGELLVFPKNLTLYHEGDLITPQKYQLMIATTVLMAISMPFIIYKNRKVGGLILLSYIAVLPVFSPVQVAWFIADRYLYIPAAMFCILLAWIILGLEKKYEWKNFATAATIVLLTLYSIRTYMRNIDWKTPKNLWLATEKLGPNSPRVHNNLGDIFATEQDFDRSIWHFKKAIELSPNYADALHNLGNTYIQMGDLDSAEMYLLLSLEKNPSLYPATYKLGVIAYNRGNIDEARGWFEQTLALSPGNSYATQALDFINTQTTEPVLQDKKQ